jgi:hypothetical protein
LLQSDYLTTVYGGLFNVFLSAIYHAMDSIPALKPSDINPFISVLDHIRESGLADRFDVDISARMADVEERITAVASLWYTTKLQELQSAPGVNRALPLLLMTDEMEKNAKLLDKRFPEPILGWLIFVVTCFYY